MDFVNLKFKFGYFFFKFKVPKKKKKNSTKQLGETKRQMYQTSAPEKETRSKHLLPHKSAPSDDKNDTELRYSTRKPTNHPQKLLGNWNGSQGDSVPSFQLPKKKKKKQSAKWRKSRGGRH